MTDTQKSTELLPCPFCGGLPEITKHHREEMYGFLHRCTVIGPISWGFREDKSSHVAQWNRRAQPADQQECADVMCFQPAQPNRKHCQWHSDGTHEDLEKVRLNGILARDRECNVQISAKSEVKQQDEPVGWQFLDNGKWHNGDDRIKDHRANTEAAGYQTRNVYARPAAQAVKIPPRRDPPPFEDGYDPSKDYDTNCGRSEGWNACLDAVAKLNGVKS